MSSQEAVHVSRIKVTPRSGKETLGTWGCHRQRGGRTQSRHKPTHEMELSGEQTIGSRGVCEPALEPRCEWEGSRTRDQDFKPDLGNSAVRQCVQERLECPVGDRPTEAKVRSLVARIAEKRKTESLKPIDKAIYRMVSKPSGRNESERTSSLEKSKPQRPSTLPECEGSMDRRRLTDVAVHSGGVKATARWQGRAKATGETLLVPTRKRRKRNPYNRRHREVGGRREGVGRVHSTEEAE